MGAFVRHLLMLLLLQIILITALLLLLLLLRRRFVIFAVFIELVISVTLIVLIELFLLVKFVIAVAALIAAATVAEMLLFVEVVGVFVLLLARLENNVNYKDLIPKPQTTTNFLFTDDNKTVLKLFRTKNDLPSNLVYQND